MGRCRGLCSVKESVEHGALTIWGKVGEVFKVVSVKSHTRCDGDEEVTMLHFSIRHGHRS